MAVVKCPTCGAPVQWSADGNALYVVRMGVGGSSGSIIKLDLTTHRSTPWFQLDSLRSSNDQLWGTQRMTPDGATCVYGYRRKSGQRAKAGDGVIGKDNIPGFAL